MARRTDVELLIARCSVLGGTWGRRDRVVELMVESEEWRRDRAESAVTRALDEHLLKIGKGGTLKFAGTDFAIYEDVRHRIEQSWAPSRGLRHVCAHVTATAKGVRGEGNWVYPDVVVFADPARRATQHEARRLHTIEVEREAGFSVESVYQAHEQGRGADYSWVFFVSPGRVTGEEIKDILRTDTDSTSKHSPLLRRADRGAAELGVGLVAMIRPHNVSSWTEIRDAKRRSVTAGGRATLAKATGIAETHVAERPDKNGRCAP